MSIEQVGALLLVAAIVSMVCRKLKVPYTVGLTVTGFGLAFLPQVPDFQLTKTLLFTAFLPPLIFEAAYQIPWPELKKDFLIVTVLATLGVFICLGIVAGGLHWTLGWAWPLSLVIAVLVSATDPVAVIGLFKEARIEGRLRLLMEAESLFNDGTAAVLFAIALATFEASTPTIGASILSFFLIVAGGVGVGLGVGLVTLVLAGRTEDPLVEFTFTSVAAYASFLTAEHFHLSGVLATLSAGILVGNVGSLGAISQKDRETIVVFWDYAAFVANSLIFLLIGLRMAHHIFVPVWMPLCAVVLFSLLGRAGAVYGTCLLFVRSRFKVDLRQQHILVWGGLRGALALALVLGLPAEVPWRETAIDMIFGVVAFSVIVQGLTVNPLLGLLDLKGEPSGA